MKTKRQSFYFSTIKDKKNKKSLALISQLGLLLFFIFLTTTPLIANAAENTSIIQPLSDFVYCYLEKIFRILIEIAAFGTTIMIIVGGFYYITSTGDPAKVKKATGSITAAIIGLCIVALSFVLLYFVGNKLSPNFSWTYKVSSCIRPGEIKIEPTKFEVPTTVETESEATNANQ